MQASWGGCQYVLCFYRVVQGDPRCTHVRIGMCHDCCVCCSSSGGSGCVCSNVGRAKSDKENVMCYAVYGSGGRGEESERGVTVGGGFVLFMVSCGRVWWFHRARQEVDVFGMHFPLSFKFQVKKKRRKIKRNTK